MISMTYGVMPPLRDFKQHVRAARDEFGARLVSPDPPAYWMELVPGDEREAAVHALSHIPGVKVTHGERHRLRFEFEDVDSLYLGINSLNHHYEDGNDAAGDLASAMMYTLDYEWI